MASMLDGSRPMQISPFGKAKVESFNGPAITKSLGFTAAPQYASSSVTHLTLIRKTICDRSTIRTDSELSVRIGLKDRRNDSAQFRRKCELVKSVTWERRVTIRVGCCRGPIRAFVASSPDLAKRWGKRFWQSCREKAESGVWRPPHQTPDFFCSRLHHG
jgi:hypothetical protein